MVSGKILMTLVETGCMFDTEGVILISALIVTRIILPKALWAALLLLAK
jgi:hypothetical protein